MTTSSEVTLVYFEKEITVNRQKLSQSCHYFECLLLGQFKEAKEKQIEIHLDTDCVSFEVFEAAINYAVTGELDDDREVGFYADLIQLAHIWLYDQLINVLETKLLEFVTIKWLPHIHTLANILELPKLIEACESFEYKVGIWAGSEPKKWPGCIFPEHKHRHHYSRCQGFNQKQTPKPEEEDWDELQ